MLTVFGYESVMKCTQMYADLVVELPPIKTHTTSDKIITKFLMQKIYNKRITSKKIMGYAWGSTTKRDI